MNFELKKITLLIFTDIDGTITKSDVKGFVHGSLENYLPSVKGLQFKSDVHHEGVVKFLGAVHYAKGDDWVGVALDDADGKNDGTIKGQQYFECAPKHGVMVREADVDVLVSA